MKMTANNYSMILMNVLTAFVTVALILNSVSH